MTVGKSLALGFALVIVLGALIALAASLRLNSVTEAVRVLVDFRMVNVTLANQIKDNMNLQALSVRNMLLLHEAAELQAQKQRIDEVRADTAALFQQLDAALVIPQVRDILKAAIEARDSYNAAANQAIALALENRDDEGREVLMVQMRPAHEAIFKALNALVAAQQKLMQESAQEVRQTALSTQVLMLALAAVALSLGIAIAWWLTRSITRQLGGEPAYASYIAHEIAEGNLAVPVTLKDGDSTSLLASMRAMRDSLARVVAQVRGGSESVAAASAQIAQGNLDLSARTEEQASALEETAASMEELSSTVRQNADNAQEANGLAQSASAVATRGGAVVTQVVQTMDGISAASRKIADIIGVIDSIAFQTNILALNAAVEAARAGEQGRGFAVVASEVRSLAGRAAEAAKEIHQLITDSVARVDEGSALVNQAGDTMQEVVASIRRVNDIMGEISAASHEQSAGVSQVGEAVIQMDQTTQQNAALVEEMSAAASSLNSQAQDLLQAVSVFRLEQGAHASGAASRPLPAASAPASGRLAHAALARLPA
ncbi:methyl-accepting chemotaxis protein [Comamonas flocculans]|uniref:Methyl-accepting chemotaxis protein n=2 Tax=Comamonas flocculans TaxID=2597701 RepID=A0A5B8RY36_9BURK|nr:methyl-accepting chemotaxis protein [Comamonas flocculans]